MAFYEVARPHLVESINSNAYTYNAKGNVVSRIGTDVPGGEQYLQYAPFDLPTAISSSSEFAAGQTTRFEYSADEERVVRRDESTGITRHFASGFYERRLDYTDATIEQRFRLFAGDRAIGEIVRKNGVDQTLYFHNDHLGSVDTLSDDADNSFQQQFDPFGARRGAPNSALTRAGFTGHDSEDDLGLIDMKGRFYDPLAGRFMTPDPVMQAPFSTQGLNRYSYVFNNPVNNTDPSGFETETWHWAVGVPFTTGVVGLLAYQAGLFNGIGSAASQIGSAAAQAVTSPLAAVPGGLANLVTTFGPGAPALDGAMAAGDVQKVATPSAAAKTNGSGAGSPHAKHQLRGGLGPLLSDVQHSAETLRAIKNASDGRLATNCFGSPNPEACIAAAFLESAAAIAARTELLAAAAAVMAEQVTVRTVLVLTLPFMMDGSPPPYAVNVVPAPKTLDAFPGATKATPKTPVQGGRVLRHRWKDSDGGIYEWDSRHGTVERYNKRGKHIGEFDPKTGKQLKPPNPNYQVEP